MFCLCAKEFPHNLTNNITCLVALGTIFNVSSMVRCGPDSNPTPPLTASIHVNNNTNAASYGVTVLPRMQTKLGVRKTVSLKKLHYLDHSSKNVLDREYYSEDKKN